jgi:WD40 repeat protein
VAFAPDGTLYVLTRYGEVWAHPEAGRDRILAAKTKPFRQFPEGDTLDISPDGQWLAVMGSNDPILFRVGTLESRPGPSVLSGALLEGWAVYNFPQFDIVETTRFTGDSAFWVVRTLRDRANPMQDAEVVLHCWSLPDLQEFELSCFAGLDCQDVATRPGHPHVFIEGWSREHRAVGFWRGDPREPALVAGQPIGTLENCHSFAIGGDGLFHVSTPRGVRVHSLHPDGFRLERTIAFPEYRHAPKIALSADGRRLVACCRKSKLVYAADTATGAVHGPWDWKIGNVNGVAISADGLTAAAAGSTKKAFVWDLDV